MPTDDDDLEPRVAALEDDVAELRERMDQSSADAAAARVLAAGADEDVSEVRSELRSHNRTLNALRQTQLDQGRRMDAGFARVDRQLAEVGATMGAGLAVITGMLERLADEE